MRNFNKHVQCIKKQRGNVEIVNDESVETKDID